MPPSIKLLTIIAFIATPFLRVQAAAPKPRVEQRWEAGTLITTRHRERSFTRTSQGIQTTFKAPANTVDLHWADGQAWCLRKIDGVRDLFHSVDGKAWTLFAHFNIGGARVVRCLPLGNDRFFMIAIPAMPFVQGISMSPFAIGRFDPDHGIRVQSLVDLGLGLVQRIPQDPKATPRVQISGLAVVAFPIIFSDTPFIPLPDGFALLSDQAGIFWIFDERGSLKREVRLFRGITNERLKEGTLEHAVLGCQPTSQGTILIASRHEDAVLQAQVLFHREDTLETFRDPVLRAHNERLEDESVRAYPELEWWTFDPSEGRIWPTAAPRATPTRFLNREHLSAFQFRFLPDGNLAFGDEDPDPRPSDKPAK